MTGRPAPRAVLFDLYGTLIDIRTDEEDPTAYQVLAAYLGYRGVSVAPDALAREYRTRVQAQLAGSPEPFPEVDVSVVFRAILAAYRRPGTPARPGDETDAVSSALLFRTLTRRCFAPVSGAHDVLARLRLRYRLGLVSDAQWVFTEPELEIAGLDRFFPVRVLSSRFGFRKPDPRLFAAALRALGIAPEAAVYVGDNPGRDLAGARNAGLRCILRGQRATSNGPVADACFQTYAELEAILRGVLPV